MQKQTIVEKLGKRRKATCVRIIVDRPADTYKKMPEAGEIRKRSAYSLQLCGYANRAPVKQAVATGEREAPQLPSWVESSEELINGLKFWKGKTGQEYLALPIFGNEKKAIVQWFRNGKKVSRQEILRFLTSKETRVIFPPPAGQVSFNAIKLENIARLS